MTRVLLYGCIATSLLVIFCDTFPQTATAVDRRLRDLDTRMSTRLSSRITGAPRMDKEKTA